MIDFRRLTEVARSRSRASGRRSDRRLDAILGFLPITLLWLNPEGLVVSARGAGLALLDVTPATVVGRSIFEFFPDPSARRQLGRALAGHRVHGIHLAGRGRFLNTLLEPVCDDAGNLSEVIGVSLDVTRARTDKLLLRRERQQHSLAGSLWAYVAALGADSGIDCHLLNRLTSEPGAAARSAIYRVAEEALTNVRKHARATDLQVTIDSVEEGVRVTISDNGVGYATGGSRPDHLGLEEMRERAELAGGWWTVKARPLSGTVVEFWVPLEVSL